jgi:hypothetical protein
MVLPNVTARIEDGVTIRLQSGSAPRRVKAGETFERTFDLRALFPQLSDGGEFDVWFELQEASPPFRLKPVALRITVREPR